MVNMIDAPLSRRLREDINLLEDTVWKNSESIDKIRKIE
jgi:hypothetical protein